MPADYVIDKSSMDTTTEIFCPTQYVVYESDTSEHPVVAQVAYPIVPEGKFILDCKPSEIRYEVFLAEDETTKTANFSQLHKIYKHSTDIIAHDASVAVERVQKRAQGSSKRITYNKKWMTQAEADFDMADVILKSKKDEGYALVCYLSQQVAEKALKARIAPRGTKWKKRMRHHDLMRLMKKVPIEWDIDKKDFEILTKYNMETRYPDAKGEERIPFQHYHEKDAKTAIDISGKILSKCKM